MLISPAEPASIKRLFPAATVSSLPESHGVDFMWSIGTGWVGVQRKAIPDLISSVGDGRLQRELGMMNGLVLKALVIEGIIQSSPGGELIGNGYGRSWTITQLRGLCWSVQLKGIWVDFSKSEHDTARWMRDFHLWTSKTDHTSLDRRPGPVSVWGKPNHREYQIHLLQGIPGIGPEIAGAIVDHFGRIPWKWEVTVEELMGVSGIGKKRAKEMWEMLA